MNRKALPRPEPSAGLGAYDAERAARLEFSQACRANFERYIAADRNVADVDYLSMKLDVENVSRCNFACGMCAVSKWPKGRRGPDMTLDAFQRLIDEQIGLVEIKLNGLGEALMQGDDYFAMIRYARERRIWVRMTTNGSLLHLHDNYRRLIGAGVNEIDISIDGADAATFERIRVGGKFAQVAANCSMLNGYCASLGITRTKMWTLVQRANWRRLSEHVRLAAALGFRHLVFSLAMHGWADEALAMRNRAQSVELDERQLGELVDLGISLNVRVAFWSTNEKYETAPGKRCPWPFERAVVTSDLRTVPCCMIGDPDKYEIGAGFTFAENWRGDEYRAFRAAHLRGEIPDVCKTCYK